ncbi:linoleate 9S-lipoxygenase 6 [Hevea brasiliensis]|uniref:linoleate 9S-lipoxygenase 6 n=1 Tax=Hevea brasiliensis TaxID=3981 RepID=UPI0025E1B9CC|nr:linoleate 9S-lipoxygenase 6 [Hevea brasiliensis]
MEPHGPCSSLQTCMKAIHSKINHSTKRCIIKGKFVILQTQGQSGPGKSGSVQIYSSNAIDPSTGKGKLSPKAYLKHGKSKKRDGVKTITYQIKLYTEPEFGIPGAFLITNQHKHEFFLEYATLEVLDNHLIHFECRSWVYPVQKTKSDRLFFSNASYLPNQTPGALVELRKSELTSLRGDGTGERKEWDRIYDYDYYNELGRPDKGQQHNRPILGGTESHPYPRRGRTGYPPSSTDPSTESRPEIIDLDVYVPSDERFGPKRLSELISNSVRATVHFLIPEASSLLKQGSSNFKSIEEIRNLFYRKRNPIKGTVTDKIKKLVTDELFKEIIHATKESIEFPLPQIITENELAWKDDEEFGHQMLAGINPARIRSLQRFPPEGSTIEASDIEHNLNGLTLAEAMRQWRIFILDHHDYLMPFLDRINTKDVCAYASRTLLFLQNDATLKPVAIELSLPGSLEDNGTSWVFHPAIEGTEAAIWQFAKAHVAANDSAYHQLISHWLHTHAVVEPFIIATRRQLSVMHPIHRLLDPHFKDTMHINALARSILINSGGILEKTLFTGEISMELSSELYKDWRFDEQALPADLLKRRLALKDPDNPTGVQLLFEDYPYGADGLEIWRAIKTWVRDFCSIFYKDDDSVSSDIEIQEWWSEIKNVGHGDKHNETWWYEMKTLSNLTEALTTLIWIASALHASVNFGQYAYASYPPNRPMLCRRFIPNEGEIEFAEFLRDPDKYYLNMLPERFETTLGIALTAVLSQHSSDEVYLGQRPLEWTDNKEVRQKFEKFNEDLKEIEKNISKRNANPMLKNRWGPAKIPYKLLHPDTSNVESKAGITGKGIPNSITI